MKRLFSASRRCCGELARLARRLDPLQVRVHLAARLAHRRRDLHLEARERRVFLLLLQLRLGVGRLGRARADRIRHVDREAPGLEVVAEHVAQRVAEAAPTGRSGSAERRAAESELRAARRRSRRSARVRSTAGSFWFGRVLHVDVRGLHLLLEAARMSVRFASAFLIAASTLIARAASTGCSLGAKRAVQKSGCDGFMISVRS